VKATFDSHNLLIGDALITTNLLEEGSKKLHGLPRKELLVKLEL